LLGLKRLTILRTNNGKKFREAAMKAFIASVVAVVVIAVGANFVLKGMQKPAENAYTSPSGARPN
jgi:hypothetical protein